MICFLKKKIHAKQIFSCKKNKTALDNYEDNKSIKVCESIIEKII